ncbi:MAG TPA: response regulator [Candidatus Hydrogenedentes bacterium]|nr:response regulator [Candidatus Hydrogenedentota bacterium]HIJ74532.1 response regulator [Candidatus Hydrogenedentota bacterium]
MPRQKILVVDDEPDVVAFLERILVAEQFEVVSAYDGISAIDIAAAEKPDVVLLDIMMPMMSGYEVCEQLKADPVTQHIPIVCLTSAVTPDARVRSLQVGAADVLTKPILPAELVAQLRRHIAQANVAPPAQDLEA